jgi:hypothetical protein
MQFQADHQPAGQQARAQAVIQQQFNAHKCKPAVATETEQSSHD